LCAVSISISFVVLEGKELIGVKGETDSLAFNSRMLVLSNVKEVFSCLEFREALANIPYRIRIIAYEVQPIVFVFQVKFQFDFRVSEERMVRKVSLVGLCHLHINLFTISFEFYAHNCPAFCSEVDGASRVDIRIARPAKLDKFVVRFEVLKVDEEGAFFFVDPAELLLQLRRPERGMIGPIAVPFSVFLRPVTTWVAKVEKLDSSIFDIDFSHSND
jgi:hypothetical protein